MRKRITAITVGICLAAVAFLSLTAFSCFGFGVEDKVFTTEGVSITLNSGFKKESIKAEDLESDDPVTQGTIFKYRDSKSGMLVVGAKVPKSEMAKFNAFDLPGFAKVVRELYSENKKIEYVEEPTYYATFAFTYDDGYNMSLIQYEACYEDPNFFYEVSFSLEKSDYDGGMKADVEKYAASLVTTDGIGKFDGVTDKDFEYQGIKFTLNSTYEEMAGEYSNGGMKISVESTRSDNPDEEPIVVESLEELQLAVNLLLESELTYSSGVTAAGVKYSYAEVYDEVDIGYIALYVFNGDGYIFMYFTEADSYAFFETDVLRFAKSVTAVAEDGGAAN